MSVLPSTNDEWLQLSIGAFAGASVEAISNLNLVYNTNEGLCLDAVGETLTSIATLLVYWYSWELTDDIYNIFLSFPSAFHLYWGFIKFETFCLLNYDREKVNFFDDP